jgi:hypothetical protein
MEDLKSEGYPHTIVAAVASCFDRRADRRPTTAAALAEVLKSSSPPPMPERKLDVITAREATTSKQDVPTPHVKGLSPSVPEPRTPRTATTAKSSATWWIIAASVVALLVLTCIGSTVLIGFMGMAADQEFDPPAAQAADPRLQGWPAQPGDEFVTNTTSPEGTVVVVENAGSHFVIHPDGRRVAVRWDAFSNTWQIVQ